MPNKKTQQVQTLDILWNNTTNLLDAAKVLFSSEQKISYAFVLLQTASEEMGRIWALWLYFQKHKSVGTPPRDRHLDKHIHFIKFMSFQPVGHRSYFEIMSDIAGFKITKENAGKVKTLKKIQKFREKNLYVTVNPNDSRVTAHPLESGTKEKMKLVKELHNLLCAYMNSMLGRLISQYKNRK